MSDENDPLNLSEAVIAARTNPASIVQLLLGSMEKLGNTSISNINPTNPFIAALEASAVTSIAVQTQHVKTLRSLIPLLAEDPSELYNNMADTDYIDMLSSYAKTDIRFIILKSDIKNKGAYVENGEYHQITIPRYTTVSVNNITLTTFYPIVIRHYKSGSIKINVDVTDKTFINIDHNIVEYLIQKDTEGNEWVHFNVPMVQLKVSSSQHTIVNTDKLYFNIDFEDRFYYAEVYIKNDDTNNKWKRINTTHSRIAYDREEPTAKLRILDSKLEVTVPPVYLYDGQIRGVLRIDVYTTKGEVSVDLSDFPLESFIIDRVIVDPDTDSDEFTAKFSTITKAAYGTSVMEGGVNGLSFQDLRNRIIKRSVGPINTVVTYSDVEALVSKNRYTIYRNKYTVAGSEYICTKGFSKLNAATIEPNITTAVFKSRVEDLELSDNTIVHNSDIVILSNSIFSLENDIVKLVDRKTVDTLNKTSINKRIQKIRDLNGWYTPFYHILRYDGDILRHRVYDLDNPNIDLVSFINTSPYIGIDINSGSYEISKTPEGYKLRLVTSSRADYKDLGDEYHSCQLSVVSGSNRYYLNATKLPNKTAEGELIFEFTILTNHYVSKDSKLLLKGFYNKTGNQQDIFIDLTSSFDIYYLTYSNNVPHTYTDMDREVSLTNMDINSIVLSKETHTIRLGEELVGLYRFANMAYGKIVYKRYTENVPARYETDVYKINPANGSYFFIDPTTCEVTKEILHHRGEIKLNSSNEYIYAQRKGEIVKDKDGNPVVDKDKSLEYTLGMVLVEAEYLFANSNSAADYRRNFTKSIASRSVKDMVEYDKKLLEGNSIYYGGYKRHGVIHTNIGRLQAETDGNILLYIAQESRGDFSLIEMVKDTVSRIISNMFNNNIIVLDELRPLIKEQLGDVVRGIEIRGLGNIGTTGIIKIEEEGHRLSIEKTCYIDTDGTLSVRSNINFEIRYI